VSRLREYLRLAGKGERKVIAVFAVSSAAAARAVGHVRAGAPGLPVWLFCAEPPAAETGALCERVFTAPDSLALLVEAQKRLWPCWVALSVGTWTGRGGRWPLKAAPFLVPPFRAVLLNEHGDFFNGSPRAVARHAGRRTRDGLHSAGNRLLDLCRGIRLWLFALAAQRFAFLSRRAFHRRHGTQPLEPGPVQPAQPDGVVTIRYAARSWDLAAVERTLRESPARWAFFVTGGHAAPQSWFSLFDDPGVFAVSRQADYRDWKEGLFATAAFRPLQPREASRVLAPVGDAILADRAKLLALGLPKTVVPGSAWLLLYWKAAAAGWKSYSIGADGARLAESPDWPYEEAEFVSRVLGDPGLRALGPREPDLDRGSIAFRPDLGRPFRGHPRVLVVSPYLPFPLSHGGAVRICNLCRELSARVDFLLACFREKGDSIEYEKLHEVFREVYVVDRDERASGDASLPRQVREHASRSMSALIASLCRDKEISLLQIEYTHLAAFRGASPGTPAILVEHDLTFTLYEQYAGRTPTREALEEASRWLRFESRWLAGYEGVWAMSDDDRARAVEAGSPPGRTWTVANGVDIERFRPEPRPPDAGPEIFYVGSFRHPPNILGFEKLRNEIMPAVWSRVPDAELRVVAGPDPERYWREFQKSPYPRGLDPRIRMHSFVSDLRPLYARASAVAVPLPVSAGTNIKVMEAMACGRAVVSTPAGCRGLGLADGTDALVRASDQDFAAALVELLRNEAARRRIEGAARRTVEERFSWKAIAAAAYESYGAIWGARP
jgi:glycosyltransferase involved in cell wall biosynthesis